MFTAHNERGEALCLLDQNVNYGYMREVNWYCLSCGEEVLFRKGKTRRSHFSHYPNSSCPAQQEESQEHLQGKQILFEWVKTFAEEAQVEKHLPATNQRADVWFKVNDQAYVLELQCSPIDRGLLRKRTNDYESDGVCVIWVLPQRLLKSTATTIHLQEWQQEACIHRPHSYPQLLFLSNKLTLATIIGYSSPRKAFARFQTLSFSNQSFQKLTTPYLTDIHHLRPQLSYKNQCRYGKRIAATAFSLLVQQRLLKYKCPLYLHPGEVGWFLPGQVWMNEPPLLWQTYLYLRICESEAKKTEAWVEEEKEVFADVVKLSPSLAHQLMLQYIELLNCMHRRAGSDTLPPIKLQFPGSADEGNRKDQALFPCINYSISKLGV